METSQNTNWNQLLVKGSGIALFTVALTWIPSFFGAIFQLIFTLYYWLTTSLGESENELVNQVNLNLTSTAVGKIISFITLILIARWVIKYPSLLRRWLGEDEVN